MTDAPILTQAGILATSGIKTHTDGEAHQQALADAAVTGDDQAFVKLCGVSTCAQLSEVAELVTTVAAARCVFETHHVPGREECYLQSVEYERKELMGYLEQLLGHQACREALARAVAQHQDEIASLERFQISRKYADAMLAEYNICCQQSQSQSQQHCPANFIHHGFYCNGCGQEPIVGTRYTCSQCSAYDLCPSCHATQVCVAPHQQDHEFTVFQAALIPPEEEERLPTEPEINGSSHNHPPAKVQEGDEKGRGEQKHQQHQHLHDSSCYDMDVLSEEGSDQDNEPCDVEEDMTDLRRTIERFQAKMERFRNE